MTRDERIMAYADGELSAVERAAFEADIAGDPALAAAVERHRRLAARVASAYAPVLAEPVPARLTAVASAANDSASWRPRLAQWAAMAACLVLGVGVGQALWPAAGLLADRDGALVARGDLARALTTQLAADAGPIRVGMTFHARDGGICRTFQSSPDRLAGVACRRGDRWIAEATAAWRPQAQAGYRTAGSETPPAVLAAVDATINGDPLDAAAERAARDRSWKP